MLQHVVEDLSEARDVCMTVLRSLHGLHFPLDTCAFTTLSELPDKMHGHEEGDRGLVTMLSKELILHSNGSALRTCTFQNFEKLLALIQVVYFGAQNAQEMFECRPLDFANSFTPNSIEEALKKLHLHNSEAGHSSATCRKQPAASLRRFEEVVEAQLLWEIEASQSLVHRRFVEVPTEISQGRRQLCERDCLVNPCVRRENCLNILELKLSVSAHQSQVFLKIESTALIGVHHLDHPMNDF
mmetsp:Transcript_3605/g.8389  ORF Transcript_3605/g.8389 Transcript_3605/m.8389 type:complete len:242 (+) Transcript_3605:639-1364(+)